MSGLLLLIFFILGLGVLVGLGVLLFVFIKVANKSKKQ